MTAVLLVVALTAYGQDKHSETYIRQRIARKSGGLYSKPFQS